MNKVVFCIICLSMLRVVVEVKERRFNRTRVYKCLNRPVVVEIYVWYNKLILDYVLCQFFGSRPKIEPTSIKHLCGLQKVSEGT